MASRVAALLLLGVICVEFAAADTVEDCCLQITTKFLPLRLLENYIILEAGQGCDISATAFITKTGRKLCVSHPNDQEWVKKHISVLEKRRQRHQ